MGNLKSKAKSLWSEVLNVATHPYVRRVSKFTAAFLETSNYIDLKNPLAVAVGVISTIDAGVEAFEIPLPTKIDRWTISHNLVECFGYLARIVIESKVHENFKVKVACVEDKTAVKCIDFGFGKFYYVEHIDPSTHYHDDLDRIHGYFFTSRDFDFEKLFSIIWDKYNGGIYLSSSMPGADEDTRNLKFHPLITSDLSYVGKRPDLNELIEELRQFSAMGHSRSYLLAGEPGLGKTSVAIQAAKSFTNRIIKIDPSVARQLGTGEMEFIVKNLRPDVLLFDDFDRAAYDSDQLLFILENLKAQFPNVILFATVNDFDGLDDAIKRPGRFDRTIWFELPNLEERKEIATFYLNKFEVQSKRGKIAELAKETERMSPAYIKELCIRIRAHGWEKLPESLVEFRRTLGIKNKKGAGE